MMKILSLFTGYGGLDTAIKAVTGGEIVGVSDIDKGGMCVAAAPLPQYP